MTDPQTSTDTCPDVRLASPAGRRLLLATALGSGIAFLDATVVNIALPEIGRDLNAQLSGLQWTVTGYGITLAALILIGGSLGDRYGRRRIFLLGVAWFAVASLICGIAPTLPLLIAARVLQGVGGALLTPGSLALITASFAPEDRARAIGMWSGFTGLGGAVGPFLGAALLAVDWRLIFLINLPFAIAIGIAMRGTPESRDESSPPGIDLAGAVTGVLGLAGITYALIEVPERGWSSPLVLIAGIGGLLALAALIGVERRSRHPMLPLGIFASRQFTVANLVTFIVYAALGGQFFLLVVHLQVTAGFSPLASGAATLPVTILMLLFSSRAGALGDRIGPRWPMTVGPIVAGLGVAWMATIGTDASYLADVLPPVLLFGAGLTLTVAPLTAAVLAAAPRRHAGVASGVNNAVARAAGLLAVAVLPLVAGLSGADYTDPAEFGRGFRLAALVCGALLVGGGLLAAATIRGGREGATDSRFDDS